jgi:hypothetical protein
MGYQLLGVQGKPTFVGLGLGWHKSIPLFVSSRIPHDASPSSHVALTSQNEDIEAGYHQIPHPNPKPAGCQRLTLRCKVFYIHVGSTMGLCSAIRGHKE